LEVVAQKLRLSPLTFVYFGWLSRRLVVFEIEHWAVKCLFAFTPKAAFPGVHVTVTGLNGTTKFLPEVPPIHPIHLLNCFVL
jgi:hypothetical protein